MKTVREFMHETTVTPEIQFSEPDEVTLENVIEEGLVGGGIISTKLSAMKNRVLSEDDPKKQNDLLAQMIHFGFGMLALQLKKQGRRR